MPKDNIEAFDDFLVGRGSYEKMTGKSSSKIFSSQLTGINEVSDLKGKKEFFLYEQEDDVNDFSPDINEEIIELEQYVSSFISGKRYIFDIFGYVEKKSELLGNIPIKEKELILEDYDSYVIKYLIETGVKCKKTVEIIANLIACVDLKISEFKFIKNHDCPLCTAHDGLIMNVDFALNALCSGSYIVHNNCDFKVIPVVRRGSYVGPVMDSLNTNFEIGNIEVSNCPKEYQEQISDLIYEKFNYNTGKILKIIFCNIMEYYMNHIDGQLEDPDSIFAHQDDKEGILAISNNYFAHSGSLEHLTNYIDINKISDQIGVDQIPDDAEKFYISGKEVVYYQNKYWDPKTGKQVK